MNALYNITQSGRWKIIFLLSAILVVLVLTGLVENYKLKKIHHSFSSIYSDRLIPAMEIYFISDYLYEKRLLLEDHFSRDKQPEGLVSGLNRIDRSIDSLLNEYKKTYFVNEESMYMQDFRADLSAYTAIEEKVVAHIHNRSHDQAIALFESQGRQEFNQLVQNLHHLARIQSTVGKKLITDSNADFASTNLLSYLRFASATIIGLIIIIFIRTSPMTRITDQKFNLN